MSNATNAENKKRNDVDFEYGPSFLEDIACIRTSFF